MQARLKVLTGFQLTTEGTQFGEESFYYIPGMSLTGHAHYRLAPLEI